MELFNIDLSEEECYPVAWDAVMRLYMYEGYCTVHVLPT